MIFSPKEFRAVALLCKTYDARPMLTVYPEVTIQVKSTGEIITQHIDKALEAYDEHKKMLTRERARVKREAQARYRAKT